jgi:hypothetical protein
MKYIVKYGISPWIAMRSYSKNCNEITSDIFGEEESKKNDKF